MISLFLYCIAGADRQWVGGMQDTRGQYNGTSSRQHALLRERVLAKWLERLQRPPRSSESGHASNDVGQHK